MRADAVMLTCSWCVLCDDTVAQAVVLAGEVDLLGHGVLLWVGNVHRMNGVVSQEVRQGKKRATHNQDCTNRFASLRSTQIGLMEADIKAPLEAFPRW